MCTVRILTPPLHIALKRRAGMRTELPTLDAVCPPHKTHLGRAVLR